MVAWRLPFDITSIFGKDVVSNTDWTLKLPTRCFYKKIACCLALLWVYSSVAWSENTATSEDVLRAQDPFEFSSSLDYRQTEFLDFKDADINNTTLYQVRYTHPVAEGVVLPEQFIRITTNVRQCLRIFLLMVVGN